MPMKFPGSRALGWLFRSSTDIFRSSTDIFRSSTAIFRSSTDVSRSDTTEERVEVNLPNPNTYKNGAPAEVFHNLIEEFIHSMNAVRDYWKGVLQDLGFEYNIPEKGGVPYYTHGSFVVRVSECSSTEASLSCLIRDFSPPQLLLRKQTRDLATGDITYDTELCHVSWTAAPGDQDTLHFLRALTQPNQLPTCVGIDWASSFLEVWLKEH